LQSKSIFEWYEHILFFRYDACGNRKVVMRNTNIKEPKKSGYPVGSRLQLYKQLLTVLYQQSMISECTFNKTEQHVERAVERSIEGQ